MLELNSKETEFFFRISAKDLQLYDVIIHSNDEFKMIQNL